MPLYEYECTACHRRTENIQKFSDPELTVCPHCNGPLERTITAPSFQFAGGGWYKDGYGSTPPPAAASTDSGSADSSSATPAATPAVTPASAPSAAATGTSAPAAASGPSKP